LNWRGFTFLPLRFWLFRHLVLLSRRLSVEVGMPRPGIGPGSPEWARGCKPRLSASSSTGAYEKALNVGTVTACQLPPVPTCSGSISAALNLSSWRLSFLKSGNKRDQVVGNLLGLVDS